MRSIILHLLLGLSFLHCQQPSQQKTPPNVIIIFTDDQGYQDLASYGATDISTPHLDKMVREGLKLTSFYSAQAVCSASRAALLTGCYPNRVGVHQAYMPNSPNGLSPDEETIGDLLKPKGYRTAIFGKWHLGDHPSLMPNHQGFDEYFGIPYSNDMWPLHPQQGPVFDFGPLPLYQNEVVIDTLLDQSQLTTQITEKSVDFIKRNKDNPFFLYVAHPQPHVPLFVSDKFRGKSSRGLYGDVIMEIDWSVGQIFEALSTYGIDDNTIVIFTSDNGPWLAYGNHAGSAKPFREGKGTALEGGHRVPCIIHYPKAIPAQSTSNIPMMNIDILPTIAAATGTKLPLRKIDGKNLWDIWTNQTNEEPHEALFFYYRINELHGVRYKNWKMYFPHTYRTMENQTPGKDGLPGEYRFVDMEQIELYDLSKDIGETTDIAHQHPDVVQQIQLLANDMRNELGDSLYGIKGTANRPAATPKQ